MCVSIRWGGFQAEVARYLDQLYRGSIGGYYTEIEFSNSVGWITAMPEFGRDYLGPIARAVGSLQTRAKVWSSPYSIGNLTRRPTGYVQPAAYAAALNGMVAAAGGPAVFSALALQDSMGAQGNSFKNASDYLGNISAAGISAWANVELFETWPPECHWTTNQSCTGRHPAPWSRIEAQLANEAATLGGPDKATIIAWEWYSCFSPNGFGDPHHPWPAAAKANYNAYLAYLRA